jgi:CHAT domain-containing protein
VNTGRRAFFLSMSPLLARLGLVKILQSAAEFRLLIVFGLFCWAALPAQAADQNSELSQAAKIYYEGQVDPAIQSLRPLADQVGTAAPSLQGKLVLEYILDLCVGGFDFQCLNGYWPQYARLVGSLTDVPDPLKLPFALQPSYYSGFAVWLSGDRSQAAAWLKAWPETGPEAPWVPRDYIRRQLIRARLHLMVDELDAGRVCVDRALMELASIENAGSSMFEISVWLSEAIEDLLFLGDTERAIGLTLASAVSGQKVFPPNSVEYFRLLRGAANVYQVAGMIPQAKDASERAIAVLPHLKLNPIVQNYLSAEAHTFAALICLFAGDAKCATKHLDEHPLNAEFRAMRARGVLQTFPEVSYLATRALVAASTGANTTREDVVLLTKPMEPKYPTPPDLTDTANLYQRIAHSIALAPTDRDAATAEMRALAPDLLRVETKRLDALGFLPRRGLIDQLALFMTLIAYRADRLDADSADQVVRLLDVAARNGQTYSSEALSLASVAQTDQIRNDVRDLLRLRSRRDSAERLDMGRMLSTTPTIDQSGKVVQPVIDIKRRSIYSDYGSLIRDITGRLQHAQPDLSRADAPPSLEEIQSVLREGEVAISTRVLIGNLAGHLCVRRNLVRFVTTIEDPLTLSLNIRLLEASLTSQNSPSEELDRQYPVSAARFLYDALIKPAEGCWLPGDAIIWVGPPIGALPLAALLTHGDAAGLQKTRLAEWPWLAREATLSQISTLSTLVALRRPQVSSVTGRARAPEFLGVGDPMFSGPSGAREGIAQLALRGAAGAEKLSALPQLPDTREEITSSGTLFGNRQTLLLGEHATEADLRRLPLERYSYLEFATHGLVRQDVAGLNEPALALTPVSSEDSFNDGLLTASEIADLPLTARFVALSACNTAALDSTKFSSEVPALSAAFEVAGVPATLGTLWPVESDASKQIVQETFRRLIGDRVGPATALALAQRRYLQNPPSSAHEHPRFWAPFVIFGDGDTPSEGHAGPVTSQLRDERVLTTSGGEVSTIIKDDSGAILVRAMGDIRDGKRHASLTIKLRRDLSEEWRKEDPQVANSVLALRLEGGTIFGGYRGGGDTPAAATLQWVDNGGQVRQEWSIARSDGDTFPMAGLRVGPRAALIGVIRHFRRASPAGVWAKDHLLIAEIHPGRALETVADLEITSQFNPNFIGLDLLGDDLLITVASQSEDKLPPGHWDEFHQLTSCGLQPSSSFTVLRRPSFAQIWTQNLPGIQLANSLSVSNKSVWFVGSRLAECGTGTRIGLWMLKPDRSFINIFLDPTQRDSQAQNLLRLRDGSVLLIGRSTRAIDVDSYEERDPQRTIANSGRQWVSFSTRRTADAVLISLDPSFHERSRATLRAGSDLWIRGAVEADDQLWLYGALGGQAALMEVVGY